MIRLWGRTANEPDLPREVCANGRPAAVLAEGEQFSLVRFVDDNGDGPGTSLLNSLIKDCVCGGEGCE
ncbi:hypothetical protein [Streptosporangium roseum]|uniref:hypothetical protein n=1 Tax=Streptosporangium roseum TaxID=2001 RepID=UPI00331B78A5